MIGILLINLGTPDAPDTQSVARYLKEFLSDPKVIDLPNPWRSLLVNGLIIPLRAKKSAHAYQQIWTEEGSPLLTNSVALQQSLQNALGDNYRISLGMNYGKPTIESALSALSNCEKIIVLPLFPQYSSAVTGSILDKVNAILKQKNITTPIEIIKDFFAHPAFISAYAENIQTVLNDTRPEYLLLSYHGLPMRQLYKTSGSICKSCITMPCPALQDANKNCYRAQCYQTSKLITAQLSLGNTTVITSFQSRLGHIPWTQPYTDNILKELATKNIKRIAVACPSFVTDCLETLEEIGLRGHNTWMKLGGSELTLIPALNMQHSWIKSVVLSCESY
jgi:protoporphyrin/coproporphyrin ferrochelatase